MYKNYWTAVILWMALIFNLSNQPAVESKKLSTDVTKVIAEKVEKVAPNKEFNISDFNHIVRKNAHFFVYLVLGLLVMNALKRSGLYGYRCIGIAILLCVLYAISDEVHQLFVPGRGPHVKDVLIDSAGASVGIAIYFFIGRIIKITR